MAFRFQDHPVMTTSVTLRISARRWNRCAGLIIHETVRDCKTEYSAGQVATIRAKACRAAASEKQKNICSFSPFSAILSTAYHAANSQTAEGETRGWLRIIARRAEINM